MKTHTLKTWPEYFDAIWIGEKLFELRKNDRDYKVGDILELKEFNPDENKYTGREISCSISYILKGQNLFGLDPDFCILSLSTLMYKYDAHLALIPPK